MIFKEKIKQKQIERMINKLIDYLESADYCASKHAMLQLKWQALHNKDNDGYELATCFYDALTIFEKHYCKKEA